MRVEILAHSEIREFVLADAYDYDQWGTGVNRLPVSDADALGEAAGRMCYQSWGRKNPATASNAGYLANILDHGHFSVLEHSSVTFLVRGVSRALLAELSRHRHLSFSVVSQRYVDYAGTSPVVPPALKGTLGEASLISTYNYAVGRYEALTRELRASGLSRKKAREAARSVLPNAAPVDMVVTGNLRAWRDVLGKRHSKHADAEIQEFASLVLKHLRSVAPNSFQDIADEPGE
ncbi:FAD-dependent thymidylate synthase [Streptomyces chartreusis]|uniref:FAD-dependent thymidylate synthase n=1 Tax=Streptomyces chartreusis TaxID=1969 RepID=UPI003D8C3B26